MIDIYLFESNDRQEIVINNNRRNMLLHVKRSWQININILQTEDCHEYGTQFCSVPKFQMRKVSSALIWSLFSLFSSCNKLWKIVDKKITPFESIGWKGHFLASIQHYCFQHNIIQVDKRLPFRKSKKLVDIVHIVNKFIPPGLSLEV